MSGGHQQWRPTIQQCHQVENGGGTTQGFDLPCSPDLPAFIFLAVNAFPCTRMQKCDVQLDPHKASQSPLRLLVQRLGFLLHTVDNPTSCVDNFQVTVVPMLCAHDLAYDDEEQEMQRTEIKHNDTFWLKIL